MKLDERHRILVMGVAGCGKTSIASALASRLGHAYIEGDEFHPASNLDKMRQGIPLDDADRVPWLDRLGKLLADSPAGAVLACSALKRRYRDQLRTFAPDLKIAFVEITKSLAKTRVASRPGHVFPASLVDSQFETLQPPCDEANVFFIKADAELSSQIESIMNWLGTSSNARNQRQSRSN